MPTAVRTMPRKRNKPDQDAGREDSYKQLSLRVPLSLAKRIDAAAEMLGLDPSNFLRMMLLESLPTYEERARQVRESKTPRA